MFSPLLPLLPIAHAALAGNRDTVCLTYCLLSFTYEPECPTGVTGELRILPHFRFPVVYRHLSSGNHLIPDTVLIDIS